jgi:hypothetical protein
MVLTVDDRLPMESGVKDDVSAWEGVYLATAHLIKVWFTCILCF